MKIITHQENQNANLYSKEDYIITDKLINLGQGFAYLDILTGFFLKDNEVIHTKPLEHKVMQCLIHNEGVVTYETIFKQVWNGRDVGKFTLRNMIKSIRNKSYDEIIVNVLNHGYILEAKK